MAKKKKSSGKVRAMTKTDVVNELASSLAEEGLELTNKQIKGVLEALPGLVAKQVTKKGIFALPGLARFRKRVKPAVKAKTKKVRNPRTGETQWQKPRPAQTVVSIRPVKHLKDAINA